MKTLLKQPLLHFLLIGVGFFLIFEVAGKSIQRLPVERTVLVDRPALLNFMQLRSRAFHDQYFADKLAQMSPVEIERLIADYVREEVLYREALALGLDREDYVVRRRLVQKLEFITRGFTDSAINISDVQVREFFAARKDDYYVKPFVTFAHIFFDRDKHGETEAKKLAEEKLAELVRNNVPFAEAPSHGDRFPYHVNYVERVPEYVASHFGESLARRIFQLAPGDTWKGPFESPFGYHLVMLTMRQPGRYPNPKEIYDQVAQDARQARIDEQSAQAIQEIIASYDVRIDASILRDATVPGSTPADKIGVAVQPGVVEGYGNPRKRFHPRASADLDTSSPPTGSP
jgi:hypothetical protein